jgi:hypothetical protein
MPAHAGIQGWGGVERSIMDSRFRGNDKSEPHESFIGFLRQDTSGTLKNSTPCFPSVNASCGGRE